MNHYTAKERTPDQKAALELGAAIGEIYRQGKPLSEEDKQSLKALAKGYREEKSLGKAAAQAAVKTPELILH